MKKMILKVADQKPEGVTAEEYAKAKKIGEIECNAVTAIKNVRLSNGLYEIKPEPKDIEAEFNFNGVNVAEMNRSQLFMAAMTFGVTIQKPNIATVKLRELVQAKFDAFVEAGGEDPEPDQGA